MTSATGTQLALHPGFASLKALYDLGKVAVIQGCGYPEYSLSHEESRSIWQTANPLGLGRTRHGWVGRHLAGEYGGTEVPGVCIAARWRRVPADATSVLAINRLRTSVSLRRLSGRRPDREARGIPGALRRGGGRALRSAAISATAARDLLSSESYPTPHDLYETDRSTWSQTYDDVGRSTARDFREIAKIIYAQERGTPLPNIESHFFHVSNGGYDTHSDQGARRGRRVSTTTSTRRSATRSRRSTTTSPTWAPRAARASSCGASSHGASRRTTTAPTTARRARCSSSAAGSPAASTAGIPTSSPLDDDENTIYSQAAVAHRSTDFRDVYGTILKHFVNMTPANILANVLPLDAGDPNDYWTAANFDLGFL
jgi:hypothetical protein